MSPNRRHFSATLSAMLAVAPAAGTMPSNEDPPSSGVTVGGEPIISEFERRRRREDSRTWAEGYTQAELDTAQAKYDLVFPPDLVALLREKRPVLGYDWRSDDTEIREMLAWPLQGLL